MGAHLLRGRDEVREGRLVRGSVLEAAPIPPRQPRLPYSVLEAFGSVLEAAPRRELLERRREPRLGAPLSTNEGAG